MKLFVGILSLILLANCNGSRDWPFGTATPESTSIPSPTMIPTPTAVPTMAPTASPTPTPLPPEPAPTDKPTPNPGFACGSATANYSITATGVHENAVTLSAPGLSSSVDAYLLKEGKQTICLFHGIKAESLFVASHIKGLSCDVSTGPDESSAASISCVPQLEPANGFIKGTVIGLAPGDHLRWSLHSIETYGVAAAKVDSNGEFWFRTVDGSYRLEIDRTPTGASCEMRNWQGRIERDNVPHFRIACRYDQPSSGNFIRVNISDTEKAIAKIFDHGDTRLTVFEEGQYYFTENVVTGDDLTIFSRTYDSGVITRSCTLETGVGTDGAVADIAVTCVPAPFSHGILAGRITSDINEATPLIFREGIKMGAGGKLVFDPPNRKYRSAGTFYSVDILISPHNLSCSMTNAFGRYGGKDANGNVDIHCTQGNQTIESIWGKISGLTEDQALNLNITSASHSSLFTVTKDGDYDFHPRMFLHDDYHVEFVEQPDGATCTLDHGTGKFGTHSFVPFDIICQ